MCRIQGQAEIMSLGGYLRSEGKSSVITEIHSAVNYLELTKNNRGFPNMLSK